MPSCVRASECARPHVAVFCARVLFMLKNVDNEQKESILCLLSWIFLVYLVLQDVFTAPVYPSGELSFSTQTNGCCSSHQTSPNIFTSTLDKICAKIKKHNVYI